MKLTVPIYHDIVLSDSDIRKVTIHQLQRLIEPGEFIRKIDGQDYLMQNDPDWRHGSVHEYGVRPATELDKAVIYLLNELSRIK